MIDNIHCLFVFKIEQMNQQYEILLFLMCVTRIGIDSRILIAWQSITFTFNLHT